MKPKYRCLTTTGIFVKAKSNKYINFKRVPYISKYVFWLIMIKIVCITIKSHVQRKPVFKTQINSIFKYRAPH